MTEPKSIRCFLAVVDCGSISQAAIKLNVAQLWLSTYIRKFERKLGVEPFDRSARKVTLSPAGLKLVEPARAHLAYGGLHLKL